MSASQLPRGTSPQRSGHSTDMESSDSDSNAEKRPGDGDDNRSTPLQSWVIPNDNPDEDKTKAGNPSPPWESSYSWEDRILAEKEDQAELHHNEGERPSSPPYAQTRHRATPTTGQRRVATRPVGYTERRSHSQGLLHPKAHVGQ